MSSYNSIINKNTELQNNTKTRNKPEEKAPEWRSFRDKIGKNSAVNKINSTNKINKIKNRLYLKLGRDASDEEIVESDSTIKILDVKNYSNGKQEVSIDSSFTEDSEYGYADILEGDDYRKIIFSTNHNELTKEIRNVLCNLNKREAVIIKMFFGLEDEQSKKLKEIGDSLGLTMERVRQIKEDALRKLRTYNNSSRLIEFSNVDLNK